jgi:hypothetical protein
LIYVDFLLCALRKINFVEFLGVSKVLTKAHRLKLPITDLQMIAGPASADGGPSEQCAATSILGKIYNSQLSTHASFFEAQIKANGTNSTADNKKAIEAALAEKKRVAAIRSAEEEKERAAKEEEEKKKADSKARLAARAAAFAQ